MGQTIRDVMTPDPVSLPASSTVTDAARSMKERDIGDVIIVEEGKVAGVLTDRDIVVRALATGRDPATTSVSEVCSRDLVSISPDDEIDQAVQMMRDKAIRRLPVLDGDTPVGMVSIGDLALDRDQRSALADISAAKPNQ